MPRAKPFDKKTSTTYALVNRPQHDPLIHDSEAPSQVFTEIGSSARHLKNSKVKQRGDLEEEFGLAAAIRDNEGEAAEHGVFYDDSSYDYMQHMRDLGRGTNATWIEAKPKQKGKGQAKQSLEDALSATSLDDDMQSVSVMSMASKSTRPGTRSVFEQQQDVPDDLTGLQLDMDPRLRETLAALDDEEYVDDDDDLFAELAANGNEEMDRDEWEETLYTDEAGWESDDTEKPAKEYREDAAFPEATRPERARPLDVTERDETSDTSIPAPPAGTQDLFVELARPKGANDKMPTLQQARPQTKPIDLSSSSVLSSASQFGRKKKRKGALTSSTGFSMTSSALARTEPLSLLDSRFDKIAETYMEDREDADIDDAGSLASGMTGLSKMSGMSRASAWGGSQASQAPQLMPASFDNVLNEFIGGAEGQTKGRLMRKSGPQGRWQKGQGMKQLDEVRAGLGPARLKGYETAQRV